MSTNESNLLKCTKCGANMIEMTNSYTLECLNCSSPYYKEKELTLDDYDDVSEWTIEREDKDDPMSRQYMLCKTCNFATDDTFKFVEHSCVLDEE